MKEYIAGIDTGGTRVKLGAIERQGRVLASVFKAAGLCRDDLAGAGVSIGSFVFAPGGEMDGMSEFVPFFVCGSPCGKSWNSSGAFLPGGQ